MLLSGLSTLVVIFRCSDAVKGKSNKDKDKDKVEVEVEAEEFNASRSGSLKSSMP